MSGTKIKTILTRMAVLLLVIGLVFSADSTDLMAKKKRKSARKSKVTRNIAKLKEERVAKLYEIFPLASEWEGNGVYPYNDMQFLNNYDRISVYEDFNKRKLLIERINDWMGTPYRYAGHSRNGIDCSNFTSAITEEVLGIKVTCGSKAQCQLFTRIDGMENLQFGDFVYFTGRNKRSKSIGHAGIYIGNGLFAHSSTGRGVIYSQLSEGYYTMRFRFGTRITVPDLKLAHNFSR